LQFSRAQEIRCFAETLILNAICGQDHLTHFAIFKELTALCGQMKKSTHSDEYGFVLKKLIEMRESAGLTQQQLADALEREQSFVWRIEHGERRLDVVEFFWVCDALGQDAKAVYAELAAAFLKCK
jgi:hypothetical protein